MNLELRIPPAILVLLIAVAMWALTIVFPGMSTDFTAGIVLAVCFISIGIVIVVLGVFEFRRAQTTLDPRYPEKSSHLVVSGVYRITRNPMYLGFLLALVGWSFYLMNWLVFLLLPVFVAYMNKFQIVPEERYMMQKFGDEFKNYTVKVRRWF